MKALFTKDLVNNYGLEKKKKTQKEKTWTCKRAIQTDPIYIYRERERERERGSNYTWCNFKQYYTTQYFLIGCEY